MEEERLYFEYLSNADGLPIYFLVSYTVIPSLVNETLRHVSSSTWGNTLSPNLERASHPLSTDIHGLRFGGPDSQNMYTEH